MRPARRGRAAERPTGTEPQYGDTDMETARVLLGNDTISDDIFSIQDGPDRKGSFLLVSTADENRRVRAHHSRLLRVCADGAAIVKTDTALTSACPDCGHDCTIEVGDTQATCPTHGKFAIDWGKIEPGRRPAVKEPHKKVTTIARSNAKTKAGKSQQKKQRASMDIDFDAIKKIGELFTKSGVEFDYPGYVVKSHTVLIDDGDNSRKYCFNSYNGTWGKKSKDVDLQSLINNDCTKKNVWYYLKRTLAQERKKLEDNGYVRDG